MIPGVDSRPGNMNEAVTEASGLWSSPLLILGKTASLVKRASSKVGMLADGNEAA